MALSRLVFCAIALILAVSLASVFAQPGMPKKVKKEHKCSVCRAVVKELIKKTGTVKKRTESKVIEAIDDICAFENFRVYEFPPPVMVKACGVFMGDHEDAVAEAVLRQGSQTEDEVADAVCLERTKVCKGVKLEDGSSSGGAQVFMDNKPMGGGEEDEDEM